MRSERHAFFGQLAQIGQRHDLKAAAIGQDRLVPVHELVQTTQPRDPLRRGAQHQVIGIAQQDVSARGCHAFGHHRLDGGRSPNRHKGRGPNVAARRVDHAGACLAVGCLEIELELVHLGVPFVCRCSL